MDKLDFIKINNFCPSKHAFKRMKIKAQNWETYLQIIYLIKGL